jgi:sulfite exporter TauE/SafE
MNLSITIPALLIGLGGSLHCIGMCGPLMLSAILQPGSNSFPVSRWLLYQSGRIITYALWGMLFGSIGFSLKWFGWQQNMSLALGVSILLMLFMLKFFPTIESSIASNRIYGIITRKLSPLIMVRNNSSSFFSGVLNGMLPCGLVYMAIAGAAVMQDPVKGAIFMVVFGLGTLPLLLAVLFAGKSLQPNIRKYVSVAYPYILASMAVLLIIRGLNLGSVFSPALAPDKTGIVHCATE